MRDRWHQPARASLVPALAEALALADPAVLGVCLAGSGPTIVALHEGDAAPVAAALQAVYDRLDIRCTIRRFAAHQPD
jgi:homoserine kinase